MDVELRLDDSVAVLRHHAKSFFWASLFLPSHSRVPIADLYAVCRYIDDLSDEYAPTTARRKLLQLKEEIEQGLFPASLVFEGQGIQRRWLLDLIDGALYDTQFKPFQTEEQLDLYCYQVAGVVGLMMCPLLGVRDPVAYQHAVDLGSAMQLTNIARDVAEDARRGRIYIPKSWLTTNQKVTVKPEWLRTAEGIEFTLNEVGAAELVQRLLAKADGLYLSGLRGLGYIPWTTRLSIAVAAEVYRDIATSLRKQNFEPFRGRAYVKPWRKLYLSIKALWRACRARRNTLRSPYESQNHSWHLPHNAILSGRDSQPDL